MAVVHVDFLCLHMFSFCFGHSLACVCDLFGFYNIKKFSLLFSFIIRMNFANTVRAIKPRTRFAETCSLA